MNSGNQDEDTTTSKIVGKKPGPVGKLRILTDDDGHKIRLSGEFAMGSVYLAQDENNKLFAVKTTTPQPMPMFPPVMQGMMPPPDMQMPMELPHDLEGHLPTALHSETPGFPSDEGHFSQSETDFPQQAMIGPMEHMIVEEDLFDPLLLAKEARIYTAIEENGCHENVLQHHGIHSIEVDTDGKEEEFLVVEHVHAIMFFELNEELKKARDKGEITNEEYTGVIQLVIHEVMGALKHVNSADIEHVDISHLNNVLIDRETLRSVLFDFGTSKQKIAPSLRSNIAEKFEGDNLLTGINKADMKKIADALASDQFFYVEKEASRKIMHIRGIEGDLNSAQGDRKALEQQLNTLKKELFDLLDQKEETSIERFVRRAGYVSEALEEAKLRGYKEKPQFVEHDDVLDFEFINNRMPSEQIRNVMTKVLARKGLLIPTGVYVDDPDGINKHRGVSNFFASIKRNISNKLTKSNAEEYKSLPDGDLFSNRSSSLKPTIEARYPSRQVPDAPKQSPGPRNEEKVIGTDEFGGHLLEIKGAGKSVKLKYVSFEGMGNKLFPINYQFDHTPKQKKDKAVSTSEEQAAGRPKSPRHH